MKFISFFLIGVIAFLLVITGISLFIPAHVTVSRATNLAPGADSVLLQVSDLENWKNWHPQFSGMRLTDVVRKNGYVRQARANGILLTVTSISDTLVTVEMKKGEKPVDNNWRLIKHNASDSLTLQNYLDFNFAWYPWDKFSSLMLESTYGPVMEKSLQNLKNISR